MSEKLSVATKAAYCNIMYLQIPSSCSGFGDKTKFSPLKSSEITELHRHGQHSSKYLTYITAFPGGKCSLAQLSVQCSETKENITSCCCTEDTSNATCYACSVA